MGHFPAKVKRSPPTNSATADPTRGVFMRNKEVFVPNSRACRRQLLLWTSGAVKTQPVTGKRGRRRRDMGRGPPGPVQSMSNTSTDQGVSSRGQPVLLSRQNGTALTTQVPPPPTVQAHSTSQRHGRAHTRDLSRPLTSIATLPTHTHATPHDLSRRSIATLARTSPNTTHAPNHATRPLHRFEGIVTRPPTRPRGRCAPLLPIRTD